jgi:glycosyltransferase involved in cell wall biosynthesis
MPEIRVAFFLPHFAGGGVERVAVNLAEEYQKRGIKVDFVLAQAEAKGISADRLPMYARIIDLKAPRLLYALPALAHYLHKERPDAIFSAPLHTHIILMLAKMISGSAVRTMLHVGNHVSTQRQNSGKLQEKIYPFLLWLLQRYANAFVAVSDGVARDLARVANIPPGKIRVVYNPIYRAEMEDLMMQPVDHPWFSNGQAPVILAAGRLVEQKDYPTLLRAFVRLRSQRAARLVILGEGKLLSGLKTLSVELKISGDVDFAGFDPNPYRYMARCSVFVLSSAWEGFANVVAEALACGSQVVSTDCKSGPAEILANGQYGQLVPVGDDIALAKAIIYVLDHPLQKDILCQRGRSFTASDAALQYLDAVGIRLP